MREPVGGSSTGATTMRSRLVDRLAYAASAMGLERWARLGSVAIVPLFLRDAEGSTIPVYGALTAYVLLTALARRDRFVRGGDLVVAAAIIAATEGQVAPFLLFLMVAVAGPASAGGVKAGLAAGTTLSLVLLAALGLGNQLDELGFQGTVPVTLLLPLTGVTSASASRMIDEHIATGRLKLQEANRLLSALLALADDLPGGLDATTVAAAVLAEVRREPGVTAVAMLVEERGVMHVASSHAMHPGRLPALRIDLARRIGDLRLRTPRQLPRELHRACDDQPFWLGVRLGPAEQPIGLLLVATADPDTGAQLRPVLAALGVDATIALQNARLFDGTLARAADAARRRLAADLHDGVAQSLAHLKMELELHAWDGGRRSADAELGRLARVAGTALSDLRATIAGLREDASDDLAGLLEQHVAEITSAGGPRIDLEVVGAGVLGPERTEDVFRIAQEALSNALRHAQASVVTVSLERDDRLLELVVEDDGVGRGEASDHTGGGVGLPSMQERAERLGGTIRVRDRLGGGTVVALRCATQASRDSNPTTNRTTVLAASPRRPQRSSK